MKTFLQNHLDDAFIAVGTGLVVYATWRLSPIAAIYVTGIFFIAAGVLLGLGGRSQ